MRFSNILIITIVFATACLPPWPEVADTGDTPANVDTNADTDSGHTGLDDTSIDDTGDSDSDADTDSDTDADTDADTDSDTDADTDTGCDTGDTAPPLPVDADGDGVTVEDGDCDDANATVYPGAVEYCDGFDNDCDGTTDEADAADATTWYRDADSDGYGTTAFTDVNCDCPTGYVADSTDCDDSSHSIYPGMTETCDGLDNDCDGLVDDGLATTVQYLDADGDGYGDASASAEDCAMLSGYVVDATDCDDADASIYPGASEYCNGVDDDCDGVSDDGMVFLAWYIDLDGDGYGDSATTITSCSIMSGYVTVDGDCDDSDTSVNPGVAESCNDADDDCDGAADNGLATTVQYLDADGDGYGDVSISAEDCAMLSGYVVDATDCDDADASVNPSAVEYCDGFDNDCDGVIDDGWNCEDVDSDGIANEDDLVDLIDADGDGGIDACVPGFLVFADPYSTAAAYIQFNEPTHGLPYTSLISSRSQNGDVDGDGVMDSWCVTTDDFAWTTGAESFRFVSSLSTADSSVSADPTNCADWEIPDFEAYCLAFGEACCQYDTSWDGCSHVLWAPYIHDNGTDLSCP